MAEIVDFNSRYCNKKWGIITAQIKDTIKQLSIGLMNYGAKDSGIYVQGAILETLLLGAEDYWYKFLHLDFSSDKKETVICSTIVPDNTNLFFSMQTSEHPLVITGTQKIDEDIVNLFTDYLELKVKNSNTTYGDCPWGFYYIFAAAAQWLQYINSEIFIYQLKENVYEFYFSTTKNDVTDYNKIVIDLNTAMADVDYMESLE
jgi:hypothetical protein